MHTLIWANLFKESFCCRQTTVTEFCHLEQSTPCIFFLLLWKLRVPVPSQDYGLWCPENCDWLMESLRAWLCITTDYFQNGLRIISMWLKKEERYNCSVSLSSQFPDRRDGLLNLRRSHHGLYTPPPLLSPPCLSSLSVSVISAFLCLSVVWAVFLFCMRIWHHQIKFPEEATSTLKSLGPLVFVKCWDTEYPVLHSSWAICFLYSK